jgi:hypothetical protein
MRFSMGWVLSAMALLIFAVSVISPNTSQAQYKAEANSILTIGNRIPLLSGTDPFGRNRS